VSDQYPPDEFDEIAQRGGPVGVHRAPRPWWTRILAPIVIFLIAGGAAFVVAKVLWSQQVDTPDEPTPTIEETISTTVTSTPDVTVTPSDTPEPTPSETATVEYDAKIAVLNGSGISGLAGKNEKALEEAGFSDVTADNLGSGKPDSNLVVYTGDEFKATAEEVAEQLGISDIALDVTHSGADVEVQLVTDPSK